MNRAASALVFATIFGITVAHAQTFNVFAAASLRESAKEIAQDFQKRYPNYKVSLNFGGSQQLAAQIRQGSPVDILLSAGTEPLKSVRYDKESFRIFATNELALVVSPNARVNSLRDLSQGVRIVVADKHVPVGKYTELMFAKASADYGAIWLEKVNKSVISREQDVRAVLAKVALNEADAGIVYVTDYMTVAKKIRQVNIPDKFKVIAQYPAVRFSGSSNAEVAKDFMKFLFEREAQKALVKHGFGSPIVSGKQVRLCVGGHETVLNSVRLRSLPFLAFSASEHGVKRKFKGYDLRPMIEKVRVMTGHTVAIKLIAADGYTQSVSIEDAFAGGIFLVGTPHENYQIIFPKLTPKFWVHWVRDIIVQ